MYFGIKFSFFLKINRKTLILRISEIKNETILLYILKYQR